jgi:putative redox protein
VQHVARLLKGGLDEILARGEGRVDIGGRPFTLRRSFIEDLRQHDQGQRIAALKRPLLVLHAPRDAIVGIDNASAIFQAARHPKSFISLDDADHLLSRAADAEYAAEVIAAWASRYVAAAAAPATSVPEGHVVVETTGVGRFQVAIAAGPHRLLGDEPESAGGLGSGLSPYELLSAGLGACTAMTLRLYADQKQWPLAGTRVEVAHCKRKGESPADLFARRITLEGALDAAQRARLLDIADRCPVHRTLEAGSRIKTSAAMAAGEPGQHALDMAATCAERAS